MTNVCPRKIFARGGELKHTGSPMACHFPSSTCMLAARTGEPRLARLGACESACVLSRLCTHALPMYTLASFVCACVSLRLSNRPRDPQNPFNIYLHNYGIVDTRCALSAEKNLQKSRFQEKKNVSPRNRTWIAIVDRSRCLLFLASGKVTRIKWQTCSNGIYAADTAFWGSTNQCLSLRSLISGVVSGG